MYRMKNVYLFCDLLKILNINFNWALHDDNGYLNVKIQEIRMNI